MHLPWTITYFKRWTFWAKLSDLAFYVIVPWYLFFQCIVNLWYWNPIFFVNVSSKWALPGDAFLQIFLHTHIYLSFYSLSLNPSLSQFSNPENSFPKCFTKFSNRSGIFFKVLPLCQLSMLFPAFIKLCKEMTHIVHSWTMTSDLEFFSFFRDYQSKYTH